MASESYVPKPIEKGYFDICWNTANPGGLMEIPGGQAAEFFTKSSVDTGILRTIWSLCTPSGSMNLSQFNTALRYISMVQNGEIPISKERLLATLNAPHLGPPKFDGITIPQIGPNELKQYAITPA